MKNVFTKNWNESSTCVVGVILTKISPNVHRVKWYLPVENVL